MVPASLAFSLPVPAQSTQSSLLDSVLRRSEHTLQVFPEGNVLSKSSSASTWNKQRSIRIFCKPPTAVSRSSRRWSTTPCVPAPGLRGYRSGSNRRLVSFTFQVCCSIETDKEAHTTAESLPLVIVGDTLPATLSYTQAGKEALRTLSAAELDVTLANSISVDDESTAAHASHGSSAGSESEKDPEDQHLKGIILVTIITALYATNFAVVKHMESSVAPSLSTLLRFGLASTFFTPFLWKADRAVILAGLELSGWLWCGYASQAMSLQTVEANKSAFIAALTVVMVPLIEFLFMKRTIRPRNWAAALLAVGGIALLEAGGLVAPNSGDLWSLLMAFCWAVAFIRLEKHSAKYPSLPLTGAQLLGVTTLSLGWVAATQPEINLSTIPWSEIAYTGVFTTALTVWLETVALKYVSAVETTVIFSMEPVWAAGFSSVLLGEHLSSQGVVGAVTIIAACIISQLNVSPRDVFARFLASSRRLRRPSTLQQHDGSRHDSID